MLTIGAGRRDPCTAPITVMVGDVVGSDQACTLNRTPVGGAEE
ncbi:hypothetical protein [Rathayibacter sp. VKM Ac-2759]|nr:hypothetical protein [Rathayibacter sp. VKM Ac-2759]